MNLGALIDSCRTLTRDVLKKFLWSDEEWIGALNEAVNEACIRARLIENENIELYNSEDRRYADIPEHVFSIQRVTFGGRRLILCEKSWIDECEGDEWEERTADIPVACYEVGGKLRFYPVPNAIGAIKAHGFCVPEFPMKNKQDEPEGLKPRLHEKLIDWALHVAYSKADSDTFDAGLSDKHEAAFERVFGPRPDEKAMRRLRINVRRHVTGRFF